MFSRIIQALSALHLRTCQRKHLSEKQRFSKYFLWHLMPIVSLNIKNRQQFHVPQKGLFQFLMKLIQDLCKLFLTLKQRTNLSVKLKYQATSPLFLSIKYITGFLCKTKIPGTPSGGLVFT